MIAFLASVSLGVFGVPLLRNTFKALQQRGAERAKSRARIVKVAGEAKYSAPRLATTRQELLLLLLPGGANRMLVSG